tara:strand:- start:58 stop:339 length:282 start_codon:yes stop_codon:yes gene_type:complete
MAKNYQEMVVGTAHNVSMNSTYGLGVLHVVRGNTDVHFYGSVNGTDYTEIEEFTASEIKELVKCNSFKVSGSASDLTTSIGTSKVYISTTIGD